MALLAQIALEMRFPLMTVVAERYVERRFRPMSGMASVAVDLAVGRTLGGKVKGGDGVALDAVTVGKNRFRSFRKGRP